MKSKDLLRRCRTLIDAERMATSKSKSSNMPIRKAMLTAQEINTVLACLQASLKEKIPKLKDPSVSSIEGIRIPGTFGSLVLGVLLIGEVEAKLTLIFEWETALKLSSAILKLEKSETFTEDAQFALEEVVKTAGEKIAENLTQNGKRTESVLLPTLVESNVLLSFHPDAEIIRVGIQTMWDPIALFIAVPQQAVPKPKEILNAA